MKSFFYIILFIFLYSCADIEFVYKKNTNLKNPLYQKTQVKVLGSELNFINSYVPVIFGENKEDIFSLFIDIEEKKIKSSVKTNQVTSTLRYELRFLYTLFLNQENCMAFKKEIVSNFSIISKSSGYNYGTDISLEKKYELAVTENLNEYVSFLSNLELNNCL
tara:strand:- start:233 stop:721 length:489 start_codon:yes stop_codon:yes gene_type:complete